MDYDVQFDDLIDNDAPCTVTAISELVYIAPLLDEGTTKQHCRLLARAIGLLQEQCRQLEQRSNEQQNIIRRLQEQLVGGIEP